MPPSGRTHSSHCLTAQTDYNFTALSTVTFKVTTVRLEICVPSNKFYMSPHSDHLTELQPYSPCGKNLQA